MSFNVALYFTEMSLISVTDSKLQSWSFVIFSIINESDLPQSSYSLFSWKIKPACEDSVRMLNIHGVSKSFPCSCHLHLLKFE